jgi:transposase
MAVRVELRGISNEEGNRLLGMIRRSSGSVVTWRRAQIVLLAAQRMPAPRIAEVVFSDPDTVRDVIHNFNRDGFDALYPRYRGGRPRTFTLPERQQIKRVALSVPTDLGQPFATWSLAKLADYLVAEEVVTDISHEGLRQLLREEGVSFQALRTWKRSNDPDYEAKKNRILELYAIADGIAEPGPDDPTVVVCVDEFGPLNLQHSLEARRGRHGRNPSGSAPPTHGVTASATSSAPSTSQTTCSPRRSPSTRPGSSSSQPATRCEPATRPRPGSRSSSTTSPHTKATRCAPGPSTTTPSSPTPPTTARGSTGSNPNSKASATSASPAPTTPTTTPKPG